MFLALLLWVQVMGERQPPEVQRVFENMPLGWRNLGEDVAILDMEPSSVSIVVRAERTVMDYLSRHDFDAVVNLRAATRGTTPLYVTVSVPKGVHLVEIIPDLVTVHLEETSETLVAPRIRLQGEAVAGHEARIIQIQPGEVSVRGGRSVVDQLSLVEGVLDVGGADSTFHRTLTLRAVDDQGLPLVGVTVAPSEVTVEIEVAPVIAEKTVSVVAGVTGSPASGWRVASVESDPVTILIRGPVLILDSLLEIAAEPIDISDLDESTSFEVSLLLPDDTYTEHMDTVMVHVILEEIP